LRDLYYDTLINHQPVLRLVAEQFGADHLMLGSDYPLGSGSLEDALHIVQDANLTETERELVLGANALRVFNLRCEHRTLLHLRLHRHLPIRERWPNMASGW
jgi:aminocarboxymuconate-semialdehyde decarboxylase